MNHPTLPTATKVEETAEATTWRIEWPETQSRYTRKLFATARPGHQGLYVTGVNGNPLSSSAMRKSLKQIEEAIERAGGQSATPPIRPKTRPL